MGQKISPISNRLGIIRGWDSNWFATKNCGDTVVEDAKIRKYLYARLSKAMLSRIVIERTLKLVTITICTARPGIIIGKAGTALKRVGSQARHDIEAFFGKQVFLQLFVKVDRDWRSSKSRLRHYGYDLS